MDFLPRGFDPEFLRAQEPVGSPYYIGAWELETLLLEALETPAQSTNSRVLAFKRWHVVADCVNWMRLIENEQSKKRPKDKIFEELTRIGFRQFGHQMPVPDIFSAMRWWSIFSEGPLRHEIEGIYTLDFRRITRTFLTLLVYLDEHCFKRPPSQIDSTISTTLAISRVLSRLSCDLGQLRTKVPTDLRTELAYRESPLRRTPILRSVDGDATTIFSVPVRTLLWWRITSGLYYDAVNIPEFQNLIGRGFERYIGEFIQRTTAWSPQKRQNYSLPGKPASETPDSVMLDAEGKVGAIVECKATKATLAAQVRLISESGAERTISELAKGIFQVHKYKHYLQTQHPEKLADDCPMLVVTLDDWVFLGDAITDKVYTEAHKRCANFGLPVDNSSVRNVVLTTAADLETTLAFYDVGTVGRAYVAATKECRGWHLSKIPEHLGISPKDRHTFLEEEFERLVD